ncbi:MAG: hypothetical protein ACK58U_21445 [Rubrivivax sp.]
MLAQQPQPVLGQRLRLIDPVLAADDAVAHQQDVVHSIKFFAAEVVAAHAVTVDGNAVDNTAVLAVRQQAVLGDLVALRQRRLTEAHKTGSGFTRHEHHQQQPEANTPQHGPTGRTCRTCSVAERLAQSGTRGGLASHRHGSGHSVEARPDAAHARFHPSHEGSGKQHRQHQHCDEQDRPVSEHSRPLLQEDDHHEVDQVCGVGVPGALTHPNCYGEGDAATRASRNLPPAR